MLNNRIACDAIDTSHERNLSLWVCGCHDYTSWMKYLDNFGLFRWKLVAVNRDEMGNRNGVYI